MEHGRRWDIISGIVTGRDESGTPTGRAGIGVGEIQIGYATGADKRGRRRRNGVRDVKRISEEDGRASGVRRVRKERIGGRLRYFFRVRDTAIEHHDPELAASEATASVKIIVPVHRRIRIVPERAILRSATMRDHPALA